MKKLISAILFIATASSSLAADMLDRSKSDHIFDLGVRIGVNSSNKTFGGNYVPQFNREGWGNGFELGVVADLYIRNYISIQPGLFFETNRNGYTFVDQVAVDNTVSGAQGGRSLLTQVGNYSSSAITIPVAGSLHLSVADNVRWDVEFGPYLSLRMASKLKDQVCRQTESDGIGVSQIPPFHPKAKASEFGFKIGTGLQILGHYTCSVHYMAGVGSPWKEVKAENLKYGFGGNAKSWVFSVGYNF